MESQTDSSTNSSKKIKSLLKAFLPFIIVIGLILLIILLWFVPIKAKKQTIMEKQSRQQNKQIISTNVVTLELKPGLIQEKIRFPGIAAPWVSLEVMAEITGKVVEKKVVDGQTVKKGDVLAIVDQSDYQNSYNSALASYDAALANQKRLKTLSKKDFATRSQLDDAIARVKTAKADLENAKLALSRCTIIAPIAGIADRIFIENGTYLNSGEPVASILKMDKLKIQVGIPESDVDAVRKLESFNIIIDALGQKSYLGKYHYLYKTTESMARLYTLEISLNNPELLILPGMFARVTIIKQQDPAGLAVPMYSLVSQGKKVGVYVEDHGIAKFRQVQTGFMDGWKIQIANGLSPNEKVVVIGHRALAEGQTINVIRTITDMEELSR